MLSFPTDAGYQPQLADHGPPDAHGDNTGAQTCRVVARAAPDCSSGVASNALTRLRRRSRLAPLSTVSPAIPCRTHRC